MFCIHDEFYLQGVHSTVAENRDIVRKCRLKKFLLQKDYTKIKLTLTPTNHFEIKAKINNVAGKFILDTGASNTCIGIDKIENFKLTSEDSEIKAAGAGATGSVTGSR